MFFDYKDWRCQLRERKVMVKNPGIHLGPLFTPRISVEAWFYHFCFLPENKKFKGRCDALPPSVIKKAIGGIQYSGDYVCKFCQVCGKEAPFEVLEYFARALTLWRQAK